MPEENGNDWIMDLASAKPVPGGGGAAALAGAMGMALGLMVGNLTVNKPKYAQVQEDMERLLAESQALLVKFRSLVSEDALAFAPLALAYGMPKNTKEERETQDVALQKALTGAIEVPLEVMETAVRALVLLEEYGQKGSHLVVSDAGVGAACLQTAVLGGRLNVLINLKLLKDQRRKEAYQERLEMLTKEGRLLSERIYCFVENRL